MLERRGSRLLNLTLAATMAVGCGAPKNPTPETTQFPTNSPSATLPEALINKGTIEYPTLPPVIRREHPAPEPNENPPKNETIVTEKPNIVLLNIDDHPEMDNRIFERLPNIKSLFLQQGIEFTNFRAEFSLCCPARATLLTGLEARHHGVTRNSASLFKPGVTIATELQNLQDSYHTLIAGKYFNGTSGLTDKTPVGWDDVVIKDEGPYFDYPLWVNGRRERHGRNTSDYSTDVVANHSLNLLEDVPADTPLFAYLAPNSTHGGWDEKGRKLGIHPVAAPRHRGDPRCDNIEPFKPASYNEADVSDKPGYIRSLPRLNTPNGYPLTRECEALLSVDEWLGKIIKELKDQGRFENTIFILTADNGMGWGAHRIKGKIAPHTAQIPFFVTWPAVMGENRHTTNDTLLSNVDIAPTICEIAGCEMGPYTDGRKKPDGQSFAGLIASNLFSSIPQREGILMEGRGIAPFRSVMTPEESSLGSWQFTDYSSGENELYDMSGGSCVGWEVGMQGDPCQLNNLAKDPKYASVRKQLQRLLNSLW